MFAIYYEIIYRPLLNLLVFFYNIVPGHDIGLVIVLLTLIIRIILAPTLHKSLKGQQQMSALQPKLQALREQYKDDKEGQAKALMELYREHKINPLSSCLPLLIQLPILIALYQVFDKALKGNLDGLYQFVMKPAMLEPRFLGLVDLSQPNIAFAIVAGALQFWQSRMFASSSQNTDPTARAINIQTVYVLPLITVFIAWKLPAGLPLYWIVTTLFAIGQQYYILRQRQAAS
jgi:YidC/Oxa1 family membrane protein insertase